MTIFRLKARNNMIDAANKWDLPGTRCPECGNLWADSELAYSHINLPDSVKPKPYKKPWPVPWKRYEELAGPIRALVPAHLPLRPGTSFGPLEGDMAGPLTGFAWAWDWRCLVRKGILEKLNEKLGASIQAVPAKIKSRRTEKPDYLELVALPFALLSEKSKQTLEHTDCPKCFRCLAAYEDPVEVKRSSLPKQKHIFRILELSSFVLCSEQFRQAVQDLNLENINFAPIEVADE